MSDSCSSKNSYGDENLQVSEEETFRSSINNVISEERFMEGCGTTRCRKNTL